MIGDGNLGFDNDAEIRQIDALTEQLRAGAAIGSAVIESPGGQPPSLAAFERLRRFQAEHPSVEIEIAWRPEAGQPPVSLPAVRATQSSQPCDPQHFIWMHQAAGFLTRMEIAQREEIRGLTPREIAEVEGCLGAPIPSVYRAFLAVLGRRAGLLWVGSRVFYPDLYGLRDDFLYALLDDGEPFALGPTDVPFFSHQDRMFLYFSGDSNDPPVYGYERGGEPFRVATQLSGLILSAAAAAQPASREYRTFLNTIGYFEETSNGGTRTRLAA